MDSFQLNIFGIISLFGAIQGFILTIIFLFNQRFRRTSNQLLGLLLLSFALLDLIGAFAEAGWFDRYEFLHTLPIFWYSLIPPLLYYFVRYLTNPAYQPKKQERWLFLLFALHMCYQFYELFTFLIGWHTTLLHDLDDIFELASMLFTLVMLYTIFRTLSTYEKSLYDQYAEISDKSLKWLRNTLIGGVLLTVLWLISVFTHFSESPVHALFNRIMWIGLSLLIYWIGYSMLIRQEIFMVVHSFVPFEKNEPVIKLSEKTADHYKKLLMMVEDQKLYQDPDLSMDHLSEKVGLSKSYLSQIINNKEGKNFFDFINAYRVEDVKQKFANPSFDHYSILGIATEAGFKSKSTFNSVFKKFTGKTPSEYRKPHQKAQESS